MESRKQNIERVSILFGNQRVSILKTQKTTKAHSTKIAKKLIQISFSHLQTATAHTWNQTIAQKKSHRVTTRKNEEREMKEHKNQYKSNRKIKRRNCCIH